MEVSMDLPPSMAVMEEPLPRWQDTDLEILDILAHSVSESLAYKSVRCAVEAVLSYVQASP